MITGVERRTIRKIINALNNLKSADRILSSCQYDMERVKNKDDQTGKEEQSNISEAIESLNKLTEILDDRLLEAVDDTIAKLRVML